jgi:alkaline phosphatase
MQPDKDRQWMSGNDEPSLAEMTEAAIEILSQDEDGFFLMVEGSQVDWAGHANDPYYMVTDFIAFDDAVKVAVDFARKDKNTQIIAFPDHDTGGLSIGQYAMSGKNDYTATTIENVVDPIKAMKCSYNVLVTKLNAIDDDGSCDAAEFRSVFKQWWGVEPTDAQIAEMGITITSTSITGVKGDAICKVFSKYFTYLGWTTWGHTGEDVPLWTYGPKDIDGLYDNTELALLSAELMGFDLDKVQAKLFNEVTDANLASWKIDYNTWEITSANTDDYIDDGDLKVYLDDYTIVMPLDKDMLYVYKVSDGSLKASFNLEGLTVHVFKTGTDRAFISKEAIKIMEKYD